MKNPQNLAETIEALSKEKGISVSSMLQDLEMNKNALFTMKKSGYLPRVESLCKFADYFQCSLDYLLGRTEEPQTMNQVNNGNIGNNSNVNINKSNLSDTDSELITEFKKLTFTDKAKVMSLKAELSQKE